MMNGKTSFRERLNSAKVFIEELTNQYWESETIKHKYRIKHVPYGYETYIPSDIQEILKKINTPTSKHIRFTPDFILIREDIQTVFLLEYKVMRTPRYSLGDQQWNVGQVEADAWENYINLVESGIDVAILIYCPYHSRPLLCDKISRDWITREKTKVKSSKGSGTPYVNIDLTKIETFENFMQTYFQVPITVTQNLLSANFFEKLRTNPYLVVTHDKNSPYNTDKYATGFNWEKRYKVT